MLDLYNPPRATARTFIVAPLLLAETTQRKRSNVRESYNRTVAVRGARRRARFERELARRSAA